MHPSSMLRMKWFFDNYINNSNEYRTILDVGSYDVNGSYRHLVADNLSYTGLDMADGPNVDLVPKSPYIWEEIESDTFDVVISGQAFEHIEFPWLTMTEIARVLKKGGILCIIVPRLAVRHRYPVDTYRYDVDGVVALCRYAGLTPIHASMNLGPKGCSKEWYCETGDTMLVAKKPETWSGMLVVKSYSCIPIDIQALATGFIDFKEQTYANSKPAYIEKRIIRFAHSVRKRLEKYLGE